MSLSPDAVIDALARAEFLQGIPPEELAGLAALCSHSSYAAGRRIVNELERRESVEVLLSGKARVSLGEGTAGEKVLTDLGPGAHLGEIAALTGRLASATVTAVEPTEVLHVPIQDVQELMARFPQIARVFARHLAMRVTETDAALSRALAEVPAEDAAPPPPPGARRSLFAALRATFWEAVLEHHTELPFFFLTSFAAALIFARVTVQLAHLSARGFRDLYVTGLLTLIVAGAAAHFVFHRKIRRVLCAMYGAACGFLADQLSVLLSFDVFYLDMTTRDPSADFSYGALYDRAPTRYAVLLVAAMAIQATFLRRFYRRAFFLVRSRLSRRGPPR